MDRRYVPSPSAPARCIARRTARTAHLPVLRTHHHLTKVLRGYSSRWKASKATNGSILSMRRLVSQESRFNQVLEIIGTPQPCTSRHAKATALRRRHGTTVQGTPYTHHTSPAVLTLDICRRRKETTTEIFTPESQATRTVRPLRPCAHPPWGTLSEQLSDALIGLQSCPGSFSLTESLLRRNPRPQSPLQAPAQRL